MMEEKILAMDLGTYNSAVSVLEFEGDKLVELVIIESSDDMSMDKGNNKNFPSFVSYNEDGEVEDIGLKAKLSMKEKPHLVAWGTKRLLGKTFNKAKEEGELQRFAYKVEPDPETGKCMICMGSGKFLPEEVCSEIIKHMKNVAEEQMKTNFKNVVISVPAYFDAVKSATVVQAAKIAGFKSVKTIPEPVAASISYEVAISPTPLKVIVFDIGAGTLDVTAGQILKKGPDPSQMLFKGSITTGNNRLGGVDMDDRIMNLIINQLDIKLESLSTSERVQVRQEAEKVKIELTSADKSIASLDIRGKNYQLKVDRVMLESCLRGSEGQIDIIEECRKQVGLAIKGVHWNPEKIDQVLLIGGPSAMPCVLDMIKDIFHRNLKVQIQLEQIMKGEVSADPMDAVVRGAALSAKIRNRIPHPYGYGFVDLQFEPDKVIHHPQILIPRNSMFPNMSAEQTIDWYGLGTTTEIEIIQQVPAGGDEQYMYLGNFNIALDDLKSLLNYTRGTVGISMGLNDNEELVVRFRDLNSGKMVEYVGVSSLKCVPINLPRTTQRWSGATPQPTFELDLDKLEEMVSWSQMIYKRGQKILLDGDPLIVGEVRKNINRLGETLHFYILGERGEIDYQGAENKWNDVWNDTNALLHRAQELDLMDDIEQLQKQGNQIKKGLKRMKR